MGKGYFDDFEMSFQMSVVVLDIHLYNNLHTNQKKTAVSGLLTVYSSQVELSRNQ